MKVHRSKDSGTAGFSLLELIVVIAIITLLAGILTPLVKSSLDDAKIAKVVGQVDALKKAAMKYWYDTDVLAVEQASVPTHDLFKNNTGGSKWKGSYIDNPLTNGSNPFDSTKKFELLKVLGGSDKAAKDGYTIGGDDLLATAEGGEIFIEDVPLDLAKKIDLAIDGTEDDDVGAVEYDGGAATTTDVYIFLFKK